MKTIKKFEEVKRVEDNEADSFIRQGWKYVPKSVYKSQYVKSDAVVDNSEVAIEQTKKKYQKEKRS